MSDNMSDSDNKEVIDAEEVSHEEESAKKAEAMRNLKQFKETLEAVKVRAEQVRAAQNSAIASGGLNIQQPDGFTNSDPYPVGGLLTLLEENGILYRVSKTVPAQPEYDSVTLLLKDIDSADKLAIERWRATQPRPTPFIPAPSVPNVKEDKATDNKKGEAAK